MARFGKKENVQSQPMIHTAIAQADNSCRNAENDVWEALKRLGETYYEKNKENDSSEYADQIRNITALKAKEYLWKQYRLSLDGRVKCDKCGAIITADSSFCNKCGGKIHELDFSSIGANVEENALAADVSTCPFCGKAIPSGANFCENCGKKL